MILRPTAVDTIIQSSTVELFQSVELPIAPRGRSDVRGPTLKAELVGIIGFEGPGTLGNLTLSIPLEVYRLLSSRSEQTTLAEWTRELTNQLMGRIKNKLIQFGLRLHTHIPMVISGAALERHQRLTITDALYTFGALRGEIQVTVAASLTQVPLEYSNAQLRLHEGDLVLFD